MILRRLLSDFVRFLTRKLAKPKVGVFLLVDYELTTLKILAYMDKTARKQLKRFIGDAKKWLHENMENVITKSEDVTCGAFDKLDSDPFHKVPSSASWLLNKVRLITCHCFIPSSLIIRSTTRPARPI
jgi:hypothetical protein